MRLFEHQDFEQAIVQDADHFREQGLRASFIEKDYYITEALRTIATATSANQSVIFKGGTSLSKGWGLIQRFSEDVDIFLDPEAFNPALGKRGIDRELKSLRAAVNKFGYKQRFGQAGELVNRVLLEAGTASGRQPTSVVKLQSYLGHFLKSTSQSLGAEDEEPFPHAAASLPKDLRRENVRHSRQSGVAEA